MDGTTRGAGLHTSRDRSESRGGRTRFAAALASALCFAGGLLAGASAFAQQQGEEPSTQEPSTQPTPIVAGESPGDGGAAEAMPAEGTPPERVGPHPLAEGATDPAVGEEPAPPEPAEAPPKTEPAPTGGATLPTAEQIAAKLAAVKAAGEVDPPTDGLTADQRAAALADLNAALEARNRLDAAIVERTAAEAAAEAVEEDAKRLQAELDAIPPVPKPEEIQEGFKDMTDAAVVTERTKAENDRARLERERVALAESISGKQRDAKQATLRALLKQANEAAATESADPDVPTDVATARIARIRLEKAVLVEALAAADAESVRAAAAAAVGLPTLRRNLLDRKIAGVTARAAAATDELNRRASAKVKELVESSTGGEIPPVLEDLAAEVAALQESYERQVAKRTSAESQTEKTKRSLAALKERWDRVRERVEDLGLSDAVSASLRRERREVPVLDQIEEGIEARSGEIERALVAAADHRDAVAALPPADKHASVAFALISGAADQGLVGDAAAAAEAKAQELLDVRRELLTKLAPEDGSEGVDQAVTDALFALQQVQKQYRETASGFADYIDERVLWVRSGPALGKAQLEREVPVLAGWAAPDGIRAVVRSTVEALLTGFFTPLTALAFVGCVLLIAIRFRLRGLLARWAIPARRKGSLDFRSTATALVVSLAAACAGPALLAWLSYVLTNGWSEQTGAVGPGALPAFMDASALGTAAAYAAAVWLPLSLLRIATRRDGLADAHFEWPTGAVRRIQRQARWFTPLLLFTAAIAGLLGSSDPLHAGGGWERVAFAASCGLAALMLYRLLRPAGVVWDGIHKSAPESPSYRFRVPLCVIAVLGTAALGGLSVAGFHYTAGELARRTLVTAGLLILLVLFRSAAVRWVTVSRRAMLYRSMQRRREEAAAREQAADPNLPSGSQTEGPAGVTGVAPGSDTPSVSAAELSGQTRTLVTAAALTFWVVGLFFVWADVLPALNKLEDVTFAGWTVKREVPVVVELQEPSNDDAIVFGDDILETELKDVPISLWDLLVALAATGLTVLAAKNLPGLLALSVFDRLPLDAGGRYAVSRLAGYAAVVIGVLFTAGRLGFEWESVQWLLAALSVGLGFGLQEIVANFVCGVIILFERPVRVGDVVTVDDITGVVSRIRIRATTITNWDRKEFIVPNKEFVTGRLLNWTLSDATNRVVIEVGVAYGSDTRKARDLMLEAAAEQPLVMKDPAPISTFEGFGDSTLNLLLRCYLPNLDQRLPVISELHATIDAKFRSAGIEIAFPQRDLHVRSVPAALMGGRQESEESEEESTSQTPGESRNGHAIAA
ncbi:mechanosensitive ion channel domain-containing protein [Alienimonas chondri]|uniref:Mechanosensitive ion channel n=1 Tax=Alienimonas chondri TaxID=2681879 RepID=A0ABX1VE64_9PLAN|nr:mechanosensitive ion channel domain-containing protein [Alienimonas chondri]NNJ26394.1 hypothetical protein [Alienimonas chondri]